tara:strand:- start:162 stop:476 length:315 start_codon:yes stop_codon:yes gene_type:complete
MDTDCSTTTTLLNMARTIHAHADEVNQKLKGMHPTICVPHPTNPSSMTILDLSANVDVLRNLELLFRVIHCNLNNMEWTRISLSLIMEPAPPSDKEEVLREWRS